MLGTIEEISNNIIDVKLTIDIKKTPSLINLYVLIKDNQKSFIGEVIEANLTHCKINILGKLEGSNFLYSFDQKPSFASLVYLLNYDFVQNIVGFKENYLLMGKSPYYDNVNITADINNFFGSHFAFFGSSGSGKSCAFTKIIQNLMASINLNNNPNIIIFDAYGEYESAFNYLNNEGSFAYKIYTTDLTSTQEKLTIPPWLLGIDEYALLLGANDKSQLSLIEKTLRYVNLFINNDVKVQAYKNTILAKALLDILISGRPGPQIRDQFIGILTKTNTPEINLDSPINEPGYYRTLRQCMRVDDHNKINAIEQVTDFLQGFITEEVTFSLPDGNTLFTLQDVSNALDFALIDEGIWKNDSIFNKMNILKVRMDSILNSDSKDFFNYPEYISLDSYINKIVHISSGKKAQIINFNINYINEHLAKTIVKIYAKMFFNYTTSLKNRGTNPFNLIIEEAHRYVQDDDDNKVLDYNIFERIAKEGRKYGILLGLISQRPSEISETTLSQCNNFLIFKMTHPKDVNYIKNVVPFITDESVDKMKSVLPGNAIAFGNAFKMPLLIKFDYPNPAPRSENCNLGRIWFN